MCLSLMYPFMRERCLFGPCRQYDPAFEFLTDIHHIDDIADGSTLVGIDRESAILVIGRKTGPGEGTFDSSFQLSARKEGVLHAVDTVDIAAAAVGLDQGYAALGPSVDLAVAFRKKELQGVGADQRWG